MGCLNGGAKGDHVHARELVPDDPALQACVGGLYMGIAVVKGEVDLSGRLEEG